ncbi:hypothetical protein EWH70_10200 [Amycolatopsis suaedae]|uniref:Uncharacterized protein n=1 Tax=Amycolatopsis suaedae TaxID=2510978 RepID=A0A4Q7JCP4_9PSEU|nr:hypothetical protein EWH70_10200 [Amycolatopsis suaedae]
MASVLAPPAKQAANLAEGDCVSMTGSGKELDLAKTDCAQPATPYVVVNKGEPRDGWGCSEGFYKLELPNRGGNLAFCFALNAKVGDCFDNVDGTEPPALVDCGRAAVKVVKTAPGMSVMGSECGEAADRYISYVLQGEQFSHVPGTICLDTL